MTQQYAYIWVSASLSFPHNSWRMDFPPPTPRILRTSSTFKTTCISTLSKIYRHLFHPNRWARESCLLKTSSSIVLSRHSAHHQAYQAQNGQGISYAQKIAAWGLVQVAQTMAIHYLPANLRLTKKYTGSIIRVCGGHDRSESEWESKSLTGFSPLSWCHASLRNKKLEQEPQGVRRTVSC